ncbi:FadR/GntR family transcriptional regulator [Mycolicibacterium fortuitum]|uniref:FadR/GntR family transcriptional regulator n=1 Tax=Mycolicibacterium fortuitum TaxID=1766 RepID=UPI0009C0ED58|nr:FCD domain-containing protein [Mycolicibacterium fortuitum]NOQ60170.1 FadR family transcriptional regulator [Mycolicibacterium fortuitum]
MSGNIDWVALCDEPARAHGQGERMSLSISGISSGTVSLPPSHVDVNRYVADLVRREIRLGLLPPGSALPSERDFAEMLGVGRTPVQLAFRQLQAEGLIERRRGRNGGAFVRGSGEDESRFHDVIVEAIQNRDEIRLAMEYRCLVEPSVSRLASERHTAAELDQLESAHQQLLDATDDATFMRSDAVFHLTLAHITANPFLIRGIEETRQCCHPALALLPEGGTFHEATIAEHGEVLAAVRNRKSEDAERAMSAHVQRSMWSVQKLLSTLKDRHLDEAAR